MAKAYICDLCRDFTENARKVDGLDFKIGEHRDEFTGTHDKKKEVREVCPDYYSKIMETVQSLYSRELKLCKGVGHEIRD